MLNMVQGLAIAERLAREGAKVVICSRRKENVSEATTQLHKLGLTDVVGVVCHVGTTEARKYLVAETVKRFGGIDI